MNNYDSQEVVWVTPRRKQQSGRPPWPPALLDWIAFTYRLSYLPIKLLKNSLNVA